MNRSLINTWCILLIGIFALTFYGCVDDEFDSPTPLAVPTANTTVAEVKAMFTGGQVIVSEDLVLKGSVISSDILGNIFKTMYIQDETGAIALRTEVGNTSVDYPFGNEVVVRLQGTTLSTFSGLKQIGFASVNLRQHIFNNQTQAPITPTALTIDDLNVDMAPALVELTGLQFANQTATYANPDGENGVNRILEDCDGNTVIMRNSDFSDIAGKQVPTGNGKVVALLSRFGSDIQLLLNFEEDLDLSGDRCALPEVNATIADVNSMFIDGQTVNVDSDVTVKGTVISSDELGNIFRTIYIQDETGGLAIRTETRDNYENYPYGSEVILSLNGLSLEIFDGGLKQVQGVTEGNISNKLIKTGIVSAFTPIVKTLDNITPADVPALIRIENVQFENPNQTFAEPGGGGGQNRMLLDCDDNSIILRNSDFASNAGNPVPMGKGSIVAVLSQFRDDIQLLLNFESDLSFDGARCSVGSGNEQLISIAEVRQSFVNGANSIDPERKIKAIVISDRTNGTITERNVIVQEPNGSGIVVRFDDNHALNLNDEVEIIVSGDEISEFNGLLQINNVGVARAIVLQSGVGITPRNLSINNIISDFENLESTLVTISDPSFSDNTVFSGNATVSDASGSIAMFTRGAADFSGQALPETADAIIAIVTQGGGNSTQQISIRNYSDLTNPMGGNTGGGPAEIPFAETFAGGIPPSWTTIFTTGDRLWEGRDFDDVFYANMSAFGGGGNPIADVVTWMITPEFDFDAQSGETMELKIADAFENGNPLKVMYSTNYAGSGDPTSADWTEIGADKIGPLINNSMTFDNVYESTGAIDISGINGTGHISFVYDSNGGSISTTIQISDVIIN